MGTRPAALPDQLRGEGVVKYRTIVADPPWYYDAFPSTEATGRDKRLIQGKPFRRPMSYDSMAVDAIKALPIRAMSLPDARVFLWTTSRYLPDAFGVLQAWGFTYRQTLVWAKLGVPPFGGSVARNFAEFLLVATVGKPERKTVADRSVITASKSKAQHSRKPEAFLDLVETVSPGPYLELFARRQRLGWDTWGNEALEHVDMSVGSVVP